MFGISCTHPEDKAVRRLARRANLIRPKTDAAPDSVVTFPSDDYIHVPGFGDVELRLTRDKAGNTLRNVTEGNDVWFRQDGHVYRSDNCGPDNHFRAKAMVTDSDRTFVRTAAGPVLEAIKQERGSMVREGIRSILSKTTKPTVL